MKSSRRAGRAAAAFLVLTVGLASRCPAAEDTAAAPQPLGVVPGFPDWVTSVAFAPDGTVLAAGTYDEVRLIDPATRKTTATLKIRNGYVRGLAFSADGSLLAAGDYQSLSLWDVAARRRTKSFVGHTGYVTSAAFVGGTVVSGSEDGSIRCWNVESGRQERTLNVGVPVNDVAVSPDGTLLAVAAGDATRPNRAGPVSLWDLNTSQKVADLVEHERAALAVVFNADGTRLASAGEDEKVNLYDVATRKALGFYAGHSRSVNDVVFLADGAVLASVSGGNAGGLCELRLWKPDGSDLAAGEPHEQRITSLAVSADGRTLALGSHDKTMSLWNAASAIDSSVKRAPVEASRP